MRQTRGFVVAFTLLVGCVPGPVVRTRTLTQPERAGIVDVRAQWEAAGLDTYGEKCARDFETIRVAIATTHEEINSLIGYVCGPSTEATRGTGWEGNVRCLWGRANGGYRRARNGGLWPFALFDETYPLIVAWHTLDPATLVRLVRHEATHWLQDCTGRGYPNGPGRHGDPLVDAIR